MLCDKCTTIIDDKFNKVCYSCGHRYHRTCLLVNKYSLLNPSCDICDDGKIIRNMYIQHEISEDLEDVKGSVVNLEDVKGSVVNLEDVKDSVVNNLVASLEVAKDLVASLEEVKDLEVANVVVKDLEVANVVVKDLVVVKDSVASLEVANVVVKGLEVANEGTVAKLRDSSLFKNIMYYILYCTVYLFNLI